MQRSSQGCAWLNPLGLIILAGGALAGWLTATVPVLGAWSDRVPTVLFLSLLGYAGTVTVYRWPSTEPPELRRVRRIRDALVDQLAERRRAESASGPSELTRIMSDAVDRLDEEIIPALARLIERNRALNERLARAAADLEAAAASALEHLRSVEARQRVAIDAVTRQVASAYATSLALTEQDTTDGCVVAQAREWSEQLQDTSEALADLLDDGADRDRTLQARTAGNPVREVRVSSNTTDQPST